MSHNTTSFVFPEPVVALDDEELIISRTAQGDTGEETSLIPTTNQCTNVLINWTQRSVTIISSLETNHYWYPFARCCVNSVWLEKSAKTRGRMERRAVLAVSSKCVLHYTLTPEQHYQREFDICRLVDMIPVSQKVLQHRRGLGPNQIAKITRANRQKSQNLFDYVLSEPHIPLDLMDKSAVRLAQELEELRQTPVHGFIEAAKQWFNILFTSCKFSNEYYERILHKTGLTDSRFGKQLFGVDTLWSEEPILPVQLFAVRHGQQFSDAGIASKVEFGTHLTALGQQQSVRLAEYLDKVTDNFRGTLAIWSSRMHRSAQTADLIQHHLESSYPEKHHTVPRILHNQLGPLCPADDYQFDIPSKKKTRTAEQTLDALKMKVVRQVQDSTDGRWLIAAALRGTGILVPLMHQRGQPFDCQKFGGCTAKLVECRLPPVPDTFGMQSPLGVEQYSYRGAKEFAVNFVYSGHGHTLCAQIFEECQFPSYLWRHVVLPHGAVIPTGLHHSGKPSLIIADAAYLTSFISEINIPYTYTPQFIYTDEYTQKFCKSSESKDTTVARTTRSRMGGDHTPSTYTGGTYTAGTYTTGSSTTIPKNQNKLVTPSRTAKSTLSGEPLVSLLPDEEWFERQILPGVRYNAPSETYTREKNILMIRAGHNRVVDGVDAGLTELGRTQLTAASAWLSKFLTCGRIIMPPERWSIAGLTSAQSSIDASLRESILMIKCGLEAELQTSRYDRLLVPNESCLFPENLFAPAEMNRVLHIVVADDYHLLKYFGACFGVSPNALQACYWPHAGYCLVTQTETGWPELRVFGNVSYLPPDMITVSPKSDKGVTISEIKGAPLVAQTQQHSVIVYNVGGERDTPREAGDTPTAVEV